MPLGTPCYHTFVKNTLNVKSYCVDLIALVERVRWAIALCRWSTFSLGWWMCQIYYLVGRPDDNDTLYRAGATLVRHSSRAALHCIQHPSRAALHPIQHSSCAALISCIVDTVMLQLLEQRGSKMHSVVQDLGAVYEFSDSL